MSCKLPPPFLLYTNANITLWMCNSGLTQSGTDKCKALVWRAFSIFYVYTWALIFTYRHRHLIYLDVHITRTTHKSDHTHSNTSIMCPWFSILPGLCSLAGSLSELSKGWMEKPHHSWQISTYLHYVCGAERREIDRFLLPEREFLTSCTAMVFFSTEIWGEGQVKRLFSLGWSAHLNGRVNVCVCSNEKSGQGWIVAVFGSGPSLNNVKRVA